VLDDPLMLQSQAAGAVLDPSKAALISNQLRAGLRGVAGDTFKQLYESMLRITIEDSLEGADEEEDCDAEWLEYNSLGSVASMLQSICTVGRANFVSSVTHVCTSLAASMQEAEQLCQLLAQGSAQANSANLSMESMRILESLRVGVLFLSHLCVDDFHGSSATTHDTASSDTPTIPASVVDAFVQSRAEGVDLGAMLREMVALSGRLVHLQLTLAQPQHQSQSALLSPLLIHSTLDFFSEYAVRYVDPDPALYNPAAVHETPHLFVVHLEDFPTVVELLTRAAATLLVRLPMESEVIAALARLMTALSKCGGPSPSSESPSSSSKQPMPSGLGRYRIVEGLVSQPALSEMFSLVTGPHELHPDAVFDPTRPFALCRLNADGLSAMYATLGAVAIRAKNVNMFTQLCVAVSTRVAAAVQASASSSSAAGGGNKVLVEHAIAAMRGIAGVPHGQEKMLHELFNQCFVQFSPCMQAYVSADDILSAYMLLLRDYAEAQLPSCSSTSSHVLYGASLSALERCATRLRQPLSAQVRADGGANEAAADEASDRSALLAISLQLLNHLATKDFMLDCEDRDASQRSGDGFGNGNTIQDLEQTAANVLLFGLESLVPLLSADLLRSFPATAERYFSFLAFMLASYEEEFASRVRSLAPGGLGEANTHGGVSAGHQLLSTLVQHLLWGAGAIDSCCARLALQVTAC
jgi:hypothetical protein